MSEGDLPVYRADFDHADDRGVLTVFLPNGNRPRANSLVRLVDMNTGESREALTSPFVATWVPAFRCVLQENTT